MAKAQDCLRRGQMHSRGVYGHKSCGLRDSERIVITKAPILTLLLAYASQNVKLVNSFGTRSVLVRMHPTRS